MISVLELIDGGFTGGGQKHIMNLVSNFDKSGIKAVISASPDGDFKRQCIEHGFLFEDIELPKFYRKKHLKQIERIIDKHNIKLIHSHGGVGGMYSRFYKKFNEGVKVIHSIHGIHYINSINYLRKYITLSIEQYLAPYADRYICTSNHDMTLSKKLKIVIPDKTLLIKNGIDIEKFSNLENFVNRRVLGLDIDDYLIGNISRFDEQKNQTSLIKAMPEILKIIPNAKLILIGEGKLFNEARKVTLEYGLDSKVKFLGTVERTESYYPLFDLFIFPSKWEGFSLTILEALASGSVILSNRLPSVEEVIKDGKNGFLYDINNEAELLEKIKYIYKRRYEMFPIKNNARSTSENYNDKKMTFDTQKIYFKLLNL